MKKVLSIILILALVLGMATPAFAAEPQPGEYVATNAIKVIDGYTKNVAVANATAAARLNPAAALGVADAQTTGNEDKFVSVRSFNALTYQFGSEGVVYDICNKPSETDPDLSLIEVTWGTGWHVEAVDVWLVDATIRAADGSTSEVPLYRLDRAFNKVGITKYGLPTKYYSQVGNFGYSNIFFPDEVVSARAVKLQDATEEENTPTPTSTSYKVNDDGYDLDALKAWYTQPTTVISGEAKVVKTVDGSQYVMPEYDFEGNVLPVIDEIFKFELYNIDENEQPTGAAIAKASTDELGVATFFADLNGLDLASGKYAVKEVLTEAQAAVYTPQAPFILVNVTAADDSEAADYPFDNIVKKGELVISKGFETTGVNDTVTSQGIPLNTILKKDKNWFEYATVDKVPYTGTLIAGNPKNGAKVVGTFTVDFNATGDLEVSYKLKTGLTQKDSARLAVVADPKNFTTTAPGQLPYPAKGQPASIGTPVTVPQLEVSKLGITEDKPFYVFLHLGAYGGFATNELDAEYIGESFDVSVFKWDNVNQVKGDLVTTAAIKYGDPAVTLSLPIGWYYVEELNKINGQIVTGEGAYYVGEHQSVEVKINNKYEPPTYLNGVFGLVKNIDGEGYFNDELSFRFDLYKVENGELVGEPLDTQYTDDFGVVSFIDIEPGDYAVKEVLVGGQVDMYAPEPEDGILFFSIDEDGNTVFNGEVTDEDVVFNNISVGEIEVSKTVYNTQDVSGSITGEGETIPGSNWFSYTVVNTEDALSAEGAVLDLISGHDKEVVGTMTVKLEDGIVTVTPELDAKFIGGVKDEFSYVSAADIFITFDEGRPFHAGKSESVVTLPEGFDGTEFYLYFHCSFADEAFEILGEDVANADEFTFFLLDENKVQISDEDGNAVQIVVKVGEPATFTDLTPGKYYVLEDLTDMPYRAVKASTDGILLVVEPGKTADTNVVNYKIVTE